MADYYHDPKHAEQYLDLAAGYDGRELIERLRAWLQPGSTVLELGMGPGVDLEILAENFVVTGSDYAPPFLKRYRQLHPEADLLLLDAITLQTERRFDCIYSNKVLYHLSETELVGSLRRQADLLNRGGILLHSFWVGQGSEEMHGLTFTYYTEATLAPLFPDNYELIESRRYTEMEADDSLYIALRKREPQI